MIVKKCDRCGKNIAADKADNISDIKCQHCNKEYTIDNQTKWTSYIVLAVIVLVISFFSTWLANTLGFSTWTLLLPLVVVAFFLQRFVLYLMARLNKVSYTDIS